VPTKSSKNNDKGCVDSGLIRELADLLHDTELSEIEIEQAGMRVRVARNFSISSSLAAPVTAPIVQSATALAANDTAGVSSSDAIANHPGQVTSPMVGTAYLSPSPGEPTFVKVGDSVSEGRTLMIVEAMKTMNNIPAHRAGKITAILVENGQPVEFGDPLAIIE
jgi:acetyl-CoA carboxylase biotin carboxyl carrier protein